VKRNKKETIAANDQDGSGRRKDLFRNHYYDVYSKEEVEIPLTWYGKFAISIPESIQIPSIKFIDEKMGPVLEECELMLTPSHVISLAVYAFLASMILALVSLNFLPHSSITTMTCVSLPFIFLGTILAYPWLERKTFRMTVLGEGPLAILYLVLALRVSPSLEAAMAYAARTVPDPIGKEFKILLWRVELRKELDMQAALFNYSRRVKSWAPGYSDAIYLVGDSVNEPSNALRNRTLEKAINSALENTRSTMDSFARKLSMPVAITNAMGVLLPVLGLILAPIASIFVSKGQATATVLLVVYDVFLPVTLLLLIWAILRGRPGGMSDIDVEEYPGLVKWGRARVKILGSSPTEFPMNVACVFLLLLISSPTIAEAWKTHGSILLPSIPGGTSASVGAASGLVSLPIIVALGIAAGVYLYGVSVERINVRRQVKEMEREFAASLFQLGNILDQGKPLEEAFMQAAVELKGTRSASFFATTAYNIEYVGLPVDQAIFHPSYGAIHLFPSSLIKNILRVVIRSAEEGPAVAATTAMSSSVYITNLNNLQEKIEDILSDSITSLKFQAMILVPLVAGVVVGLSQLINSIVLQIGSMISTIFQGSAVEQYTGAFVQQMINVKGIVNTPFLQLVVGFYTVFLIGLLGYFVGSLEFGNKDRIGIYLSMGKCLFIGTILYAFVAASISLVFGAVGFSLFMQGSL